MRFKQVAREVLFASPHQRGNECTVHIFSVVRLVKYGVNLSADSLGRCTAIFFSTIYHYAHKVAHLLGARE
jgi:hypothetical protein